MNLPASLDDGAPIGVEDAEGLRPVDLGTRVSVSQTLFGAHHTIHKAMHIAWRQVVRSGLHGVLGAVMYGHTVVSGAFFSGRKDRREEIGEEVPGKRGPCVQETGARWNGAGGEEAMEAIDEIGFGEGGLAVVHEQTNDVVEEQPEGDGLVAARG